MCCRHAGFNCAESTNFATTAWVEFGAEADCCTCRKDTVNIDMRRFLPFADEETREIIEHNFVSDSEQDSESESGSESDEDPTTSAAECSEQSVPEQHDDEDSSSDFAKGHAITGRKASRGPIQQRKSKENLSPRNQAVRITAPAKKQAAKPAKPAKSVQSKQNSSTQTESSRPLAASVSLQQPSRVSRYVMPSCSVAHHKHQHPVSPVPGVLPTLSAAHYQYRPSMHWPFPSKIQAYRPLTSSKEWDCMAESW